MSEDRNMVIPKNGGTSEEKDTKQSQVMQEEPITQEESEYIEKVFFEDDEEIRLRDGRTYRIPPLGLKDARKLMKLINSVDSTFIIMNFMETDEGEGDKYNELMELLLLAFKPYYKHVDADYLAEYVDLVTAKKIIDIMTGLNGLKKLL